MSNTYQKKTPTQGVSIGQRAPFNPLSAQWTARFQAMIAAARARHLEGAAFVKANAARIQAQVTPAALAAAEERGPAFAHALRAELDQATADASVVDSRLSATLAGFAWLAAQAGTNVRPATTAPAAIVPAATRTVTSRT
jgi:hypothetical protein